jgi:nicotinamide-nucleotide adenylyltransferase
MQGNMNTRRALFIGRFQPFHNGHLAALKHVTAAYQEVFVVIGSSNQNFTAANPLSISERLLLARKVVEEEKWEKRIKYILPIPDIPDNITWVRSIVDTLPPFTTVVSANETNVLVFFKHLGYKVEYFPYVSRTAFQGTVIRKKIAVGKKWQEAVPPYLLPLLTSFRLEERIKNVGL